MATHAAPVIKAYHDDFAVHDAKVIDGLEAGDVILWAPDPCGSTLIVMARAGRPNHRAAEHFEAAQSARKPPAWFVASVYDNGEAGGWNFAPAPDAPAIVARFAEQAARDPAPDPVRELHL
ncbi:hypothetical protein D869_gp095 [Caulobacter phage CcrRogue]|uniref:Uncharacterized protein n=1 Tax=Caulobacter phage CcrRogue TaxID=2927986 RepID=K4JRY8_9CAUD|nr:hypothetical protein D869_gp006 [Caulobacter phage CcrRogue]YP_006989366.1 hypothetical protein D869_gp095 [Caulobacter phage CcrRogue]AFU86488.1 hypothetical protein CcrRogue_gp006 [Caulobacter phage CcrRogue]AFU86819.1 hypothetical protein CcrRogue_gp337 [Caulobacter phage CcrRogue]